jgi:hypothetical protein
MLIPRKYTFSWELLGNLADGRPSLGRHARLEVYRLMQFCLRDVLEGEVGTIRTDRVFSKAGTLAGRHFYEQLVAPVADLAAFFVKLRELFLEMGIGILQVEEEDLAHGRLVLTLAEDLECSGMPELSYEICTYDEGFLSGLLEAHTGKRFLVKEVDCWCTGGHTCRFVALAEAAE